jgi:hypothetical protein
MEMGDVPSSVESIMVYWEFCRTGGVGGVSIAVSTLITNEQITVVNDALEVIGMHSNNHNQDIALES